MDLTESIEPRSDQVNADDLVGGPHTYTIREVVAGAAEQPFDFMLVETDRAYRPSKTMRRLIVAAWGPDANAYAGRRLTLYREPSIKFGGQTVGGIRISAMSHIDKRIVEKFQTTRGKRESFTVEPLPDLPPADARRAALKREWSRANPARRKEIEAEVAALAEQPVELSTNADDEPAGPTGGIGAQQLRRIHTLFSRKGFVDRDDRLAFVGVKLGRSIGSTKELTQGQAEQIIEALVLLDDPR